MPGKADEIVFFMIPPRAEDFGIHPITGERVKALGTFSCTHEQAFGRGLASYVMTRIKTPTNLSYFYRAYNDGRVIGLLRKPEKINTFKYFIGTTRDCRSADQLFLNEIIQDFQMQKDDKGRKAFIVHLGRTNWGTVDITPYNKDLAVEVSNRALQEITSRYE